ncbi:HAD family phosphatase [Aerophototrophica crusticola]|uniref:HAD family phosphatase n=1 Tax=Aerophototrophica crusticola TaxID=1709002 RepID=A0A858R6A9_9PROT|nr:HAD family phosphatase [Rhodospirillaceae bacterium B3]
MIKAVLFDVDGTLVDSVDLHARSWHETLKKFGHDLPYEQVRSQIGKGSDLLVPALIGEDADKRNGDEIRDARHTLFKDQYLDQVKPFQKTRDLIQAVLDDGKKVVLASSAKADELEAYKKAAGIEDLIDKATSSDDAEKSKPYPDIFQAALKQAGVRPDEAVVIGDTPYDAEAAGKAGIPVLGVLCGGFPEADLREAGAREIYRDPADLLARYQDSLIAKG